MAVLCLPPSSLPSSIIHSSEEPGLERAENVEENSNGVPGNPHNGKLQALGGSPPSHNSKKTAFTTKGEKESEESTQNENSLFYVHCEEIPGVGWKNGTQKNMGSHSLKNWHDLGQVLFNLSQLHFSLSG